MKNVITMEIIEVTCETYKSNQLNNIEEEEIIEDEKNERRMMKTMKMNKMTMNNDVEVFIGYQMCVRSS